MGKLRRTSERALYRVYTRVRVHVRVCMTIMGNPSTLQLFVCKRNLTHFVESSWVRGVKGREIIKLV